MTNEAVASDSVAAAVPSSSGADASSGANSGVEADGAASQAVNSAGAAAAPSSSAADVGSDGTESRRRTKVKEKVWPHVYMYKGRNVQLLSDVEKKPLPPGQEHSGDVVMFSETGKPLAFV